MRKSIIVFIVSITLFFYMAAKAQQQPLYSQYVFNGVVLNPAHMSMESEYSNVTLMNRQQWVGIPGAPKTMTLSFSTPINATKTSIGLLAVQDQAGVNTQTAVDLLLSQSINLAENAYLAVGASIGLHVLREEDLKLNASNDPLFNKNITTTSGAVGFGLTFFTDRFFIGVSAPSFRQLTLKNSAYDVAGVSHYSLSSGYLFDLTPMLKFKPTVLIKKVGEGSIQGEATANFLLNNVIWIGAGWRQSESIVGIRTSIS
jgi:type IX secretion system PorP/SprF family membrane protein